MKQATAFSPGHITGFFQIHKVAGHPLKTGSRGAGVALRRGVTTTVEITPAAVSHTQVFFNGQPAGEAAVSLHALRLFLQRTGIREKLAVVIRHRIEVPVGCGFGSSGAGALGLVFALNRALDTGLSHDEAVSLAHQTEVELQTGLGTVMGEAYGGMEIRELPGAPGYGRVSHISVPPYYRVACLVYGGLSTARLLQDARLRQQINHQGGWLVEQLLANPTVERFMAFSSAFAHGTGLPDSRLTGHLQRLAQSGITASMLMFGNGLFLIEKGEAFSRAVELLQGAQTGARLYLSEIDFKGVRLL